MDHAYELMYSRRTFFPSRIEGAGRCECGNALHKIAKTHARVDAPVIVDEMTDQINVYRGRELIAVYMAA